MRYHKTGKYELRECNGCGDVKMCDLYVADTPEKETGYTDEVALCAACSEKREP